MPIEAILTRAAIVVVLGEFRRDDPVGRPHLAIQIGNFSSGTVLPPLLILSR